MKRWFLIFCGLYLLAGTLSLQAFQLSGNLTGVQAGLPAIPVVAVPTSLDTFYVTSGIPILNTYTFADLDSGGYGLFAWQDLNNNILPDLNEPRGFYGGTIPTVFVLHSDSQHVTIPLSPPNQGGFTGTLTYAGTATGTTIVAAFYTPNFATDLIHGGSFLYNNSTGNGSYTAIVDSFTTYYVMAFMDMNGNYTYDSGEPRGVYGGATPGSIHVQQGNSPSNVNIVLEDAAPITIHPQTRILDFALNSVYPNPFNSMARIDFTLPSSMPIQVMAFDILGRPAQGIATGVFSAGPHSVLFDAGSLPSGTYFVQLATPADSRVQRILLLK
jgi:hypothetical protein